MTSFSLNKLLIKLGFLKKPSTYALSAIKQLEAECALVHEVYSLLAVPLRALLGQCIDALVSALRGYGDCMLDVVDQKKRSHTADTFRKYHGAERRSRTVQRRIVSGLRYASNLLCIGCTPSPPT